MAPPPIWLFVGLAALLAQPKSTLMHTIMNAGNPDAKRLYDDLLSNYNKLVRPVVNTTDPLTVRIKLKLSQLIDVVRKEGRLLRSRGSFTFECGIGFRAEGGTQLEWRLPPPSRPDCFQWAGIELAARVSPFLDSRSRRSRFSLAASSSLALGRILKSPFRTILALRRGRKRVK